MELKAIRRLQVRNLYLEHLRLCAGVGAQCSRQLGLAFHFSITFLVVSLFTLIFTCHKKKLGSVTFRLVHGVSRRSLRGSRFRICVGGLIEANWSALHSIAGTKGVHRRFIFHIRLLHVFTIRYPVVTHTCFLSAFGLLKRTMRIAFFPRCCQVPCLGFLRYPI